jgi:hypothetical protein
MFGLPLHCLQATLLPMITISVLNVQPVALA